MVGFLVALLGMWPVITSGQEEIAADNRHVQQPVLGG
jgi:hypothetical protein